MCASGQNTSHAGRKFRIETGTGPMVTGALRTVLAGALLRYVSGDSL